MSSRIMAILFSATLFVVSVAVCLWLAVYLAMYRDGGSLDAIEGWGLGWLLSVPGCALASAAAVWAFPSFARLSVRRQVPAYAALVAIVSGAGILLVPVVGAVVFR